MGIGHRKLSNLRKQSYFLHRVPLNENMVFRQPRRKAATGFISYDLKSVSYSI